jgi:hypothetical protein
MEHIKFTDISLKLLLIYVQTKMIELYLTFQSKFLTVISNSGLNTGSLTGSLTLSD